jgi:hypothetical protein
VKKSVGKGMLYPCSSAAVDQAVKTPANAPIARAALPRVRHPHHAGRAGWRRAYRPSKDVPPARWRHILRDVYALFAVTAVAALRIAASTSWGRESIGT